VVSQGGAETLIHREESTKMATDYQSSREARNKSLRSLLFDFEGRLSRGQYGKVLLAVIVGPWVPLPLMALLDILDMQAALSALALAEVVWVLSSVWILFAAMTKRLHDFNKPNWPLLLIFVPIIGGIFPLALLLIPGDASDNRFGPSPIEPCRADELKRLRESLLRSSHRRDRAEQDGTFQ
jgi:uncharacterized membrane protein YhaH (DUF805 family)